MKNSNYTITNSARLHNPLPTIDFIIAVNGCANTHSLDSSLLQGKAPEGIVWPGQVTRVLTPAEIDSGFNGKDLTIPPLRQVLLERGYQHEQIDRGKVAIVLFQVYQHGLNSRFNAIWDWAFSAKRLAATDNMRAEQFSTNTGLKLNKIAYDDMGKDTCPISAGDRGFLEVASSILLLSGANTSCTANMYCPELIHAGRPTAEFGNTTNQLVASVV